MNTVLIVNLLILTAPLGIFLGPLLYLFWFAIGSGEKINLDLDSLIQIVRFTCLQAFLSAILAGVVGVGLAFICAENKLPGKRLVAKLSEVTFFLPTLLGVLALVGIWGSQGWIGVWLPKSFLYGWFGILMAHVFFNYSVYFKLVSQLLAVSDRAEEKIGLSLGASRWTIFWKITLNKIKPAIIQGFVLVFLYCSTSFVILMLLGGGPKFNGLETAIYQATKVDLNIPLATILAAIQLSLCSGFYFFYRPTDKPSGINPFHYYQSIYHCRTKRGKWLVYSLCWLIFTPLVLLPIFNLVFSGWQKITELPLDEAVKALQLSFWLGARVAFFSTLIAFSSAYVVQHSKKVWLKKLVTLLSLLPIAVSTMVMGVALTLTFPWLREWGGKSLWGVVIIQALSIVPLSFRLISQSFSRIEKEVYFSAKSLGANPFEILTWIELPRLKREIFSAFATAMGVSLGEVGALLLFESQGELTLPLWIFRLMGRYQFGEAYAVGTIMLLLMLLIFILKGTWEHSN